MARDDVLATALVDVDNDDCRLTSVVVAFGVCVAVSECVVVVVVVVVFAVIVVVTIGAKSGFATAFKSIASASLSSPP